MVLCSHVPNWSLSPSLASGQEHDVKTACASGRAVLQCPAWKFKTVLPGYPYKMRQNAGLRQIHLSSEREGILSEVNKQ